MGRTYTFFFNQFTINQSFKEKFGTLKGGLHKQVQTRYFNNLIK